MSNCNNSSGKIIIDLLNTLANKMSSLDRNTDEYISALMQIYEKLLQEKTQQLFFNMGLKKGHFHYYDENGSSSADYEYFCDIYSEIIATRVKEYNSEKMAFCNYVLQYMIWKDIDLRKKRFGKRIDILDGKSVSKNICHSVPLYLTDDDGEEYENPEIKILEDSDYDEVERQQEFNNVMLTLCNLIIHLKETIAETITNKKQIFNFKMFYTSDMVYALRENLSPKSESMFLHHENEFFSSLDHKLLRYTYQKTPKVLSDVMYEDLKKNGDVPGYNVKSKMGKEISIPFEQIILLLYYQYATGEKVTLPTIYNRQREYYTYLKDAIKK